VVEALDSRFASQETSQGIIVYQRDGGLTEADKQKIAEDADALEALPKEELPLLTAPAQPFGPGGNPQQVSADGALAYMVVTVPTNFEDSADWGKLVRETTGAEADGMQILLTGDLGFNTDASEVFSDIDTKLLLATVLLVLVLLGAIYRAVLVALTPLIVVFFAYTIAQGFIYLYAKSGATVSSN
jgi:RND superfamily putative drug exporter